MRTIALKTHCFPLLILSLLYMTACAIPGDKNEQLAEKEPQGNSCAPALSAAPPEGLYQALGRGESRVQAIDEALASIARRVRVAIRAETTSSQTKRDGEVSQQFQKQVRGVSSQVFDDYRLLCADPSTHAVAVEYDNRPLPVRLTERLEAWWGDKGWRLAWMPDVVLNDKLSALERRDGIAPVSVSVTLERDGSRWYLQLNERRFNLRDAEWRAFYALPPAKRGSVEASLVDDQGGRLIYSVSPGAEFRFKLTGLGSNERYLSLLALDADGEVLVVRGNLPLAGGQVLIPQKPGIFSAELPSGALASVDNYIMLLSREPQTLPQSLWYYEGWHHLVNRYHALGLRLVVR